jgi:hypothetical protein
LDDSLTERQISRSGFPEGSATNLFVDSVRSALAAASASANSMLGTEFSIGRMEMVGNTGTYLDSPFHRYADGKDLSQLPLTCASAESALLWISAPVGHDQSRFKP